jgi:hypothetical protein
MDMLLSDVTLARAMDVDTGEFVSTRHRTNSYVGAARTRKEEYSQLDNLLGSSGIARYVTAVCLGAPSERHVALGNAADRFCDGLPTFTTATSVMRTRKLMPMERTCDPFQSAYSSSYIVLTLNLLSGMAMQARSGMWAMPSWRQVKPTCPSQLCRSSSCTDMYRILLSLSVVVGVVLHGCCSCSKPWCCCLKPRFSP